MITPKYAFFDDMIPNWRMPPGVVHDHIMVLVVRGKLLYTINQSQVTAEEGDLVYIPKGTYRGSENIGGEPHQKYSVLFNHTFSEGTVPLFDQGCFVKVKVRNFDYIKKRFIGLHQEVLEAKPFYQLLCGGVVQELAGIASREIEAGEISPMKWKLARKLQHYIMKNYRKPIHVKELADLIQRSPNYTITLFKEATGQTPVKYLQQLRIAEARNLLRNTDMTVTEIADYLGFYDTSYFYRTFKKATSLSPSDYAARRDKGEDPMTAIGEE